VRPLFDLAAGAFSARAALRVQRCADGEHGPILLIRAQRDPLSARGALEANARRLKRSGPVEVICIDGTGHSLVVDHNWNAVCGRTLDWVLADPLRRGNVAGETP
jgi:pimeloyl-ACP methyl ester carboxylesterase